VFVAQAVKAKNTAPQPKHNVTKTAGVVGKTPRILDVSRRKCVVSFTLQPIYLLRKKSQNNWAEDTSGMALLWVVAPCRVALQSQIAAIFVFTTTRTSKPTRYVKVSRDSPPPAK
jgi:hypothetical protein